jgi:U6 snRNA-associated Sm-like protein LSm1
MVERALLMNVGGTEKLMVVLRDGRKFIGVLRSWDQFGMMLEPLKCTTRSSVPANLVLQDTTERIFAQEYYASIKHGVYIVRGENVLLLGEIVRTYSRLNDAAFLS